MKRINQFPNAPPDTFRARLACVLIGARIGGSAGSVCQDDGVTEDAARQDGAGEFWQTEPGWVLLDGGDGTYLPLNQVTSRVALICDDDEAARVAAGMRRHGCPVLDMPRRKDRPLVAEIYVDRVPPDGLKVLVELRRLLGTGWPFAGLRSLLATQPIHARVANVAELRSALTTVPHLRPYLFHDTRGRLIPVWPDP
jgi:hypothetical protein